MIYQKGQIFLLATLAAAGADVIIDTVTRRVSVQEAAVNKFTLPIDGLVITKLETVTGAVLAAKAITRDQFGDPIPKVSKALTGAVDEVRTGIDMSGDLEKPATVGVTYQLYEFSSKPTSSDHGGNIPNIASKLYLAVNATTSANVENFEDVFTANATIVCLGSMHKD
jgi:hypothetical protein